MNFALANGHTLHYEVGGAESGLPLIFVNSLGSDLRIWDAVVPYFVAAHPVVRYDLRGHGLSDCPPGPYTIRDHTHDLAALVERLQLVEAAVIGISVGGQIALDYALAGSEKVRALVISSSGAKIGNADYWARRIRALSASGIEPMKDAILARWFAPAFAHQRVAEYRGYANMLTRTPLAGYIGTCQAIKEADFRDSLRAVDTRTLVLCGAQDQATPPPLGRELAAGIPAAEFDLIQGAAHLPCVEQPTAMAARIVRFLRTDP